jgi:hypothetical protein
MEIPAHQFLLSIKLKLSHLGMIMSAFYAFVQVRALQLLHGLLRSRLPIFLNHLVCLSLSFTSLIFLSSHKHTHTHSYTHTYTATHEAGKHHLRKVAKFDAKRELFKGSSMRGARTHTFTFGHTTFNRTAYRLSS